MTRVPGMYGEIKLLAGSACPELATEISDYLTRTTGQYVPLLDASIEKFPNDNIFVQLNESVRGQDVYIIQTTGAPVNDNLMELFITLDAVRRDSAGRITAVIPYMAYSRTDKKDLPRTPITARLIADMIQIAGADRYMTIDLHAGQIQGFFSIPGDSLTARYLIVDYIRETLPTDNMVVTTVDLGFAKGGRNWARLLNVPLTFIEKRRVGTETRAHAIIGNVRDKDVLLVDDEMDTGGSMLQAVELLDESGARDITVAFTHAVFSPPVHERLRQMSERVREFVFTNTIPVPPEHRLPNMTILSVADLLGEVIRRAHEGVSVGALFDE
ncbi:MAG TPA: ribose-phosphate pyrophosphokinase [Aggregatilineales bacterium]|nr:ribose-phosphate pyrophosphokinase [Aggregatilineales bacterium]